MKGFTLVEILVSFLIMTIILGVLFAVLSVGQRSWFTGGPATEIREQLILAVMNMQREISETKPSRTNLAVGSTSSSLTFSVPQDNDGNGCIVNDLGGIEWSRDITYSLNASGQLIRSAEGADSIHGVNITSLQFTRINDRLMQIDITAQKASRLEQHVDDAEQAVIKMRN
jgi:type II secretory pathway component PulJ